MKTLQKQWLFPVFLGGLCVWAAIFPGSSLAEQSSSPSRKSADNNDPEQSVYYETEGDFFVGYKFFSTEDALKASEYLYPHSSIIFGVDLVSCPLPYRYHLNAEYLSKYNFYTDAGFAYKDLVLFRDNLVGVRHNLNHYNYQLPGEAPGLLYFERNPTDLYSVDFFSNQVALRLKARDFPFHTFFHHQHIAQDGKIQQRFLLGDFSQTNKVSATREINWQSNAFKLGANSHAGPVEIEYAFQQSEFDPGRSSVLYDAYPASVNFTRPADIYPHHLVAETEAYENYLKLHSSYTGGIVAAGTVGSLQETNNNSQTESTTWKGGLDFSWIPEPAAAFFLKFRHRDVDLDTPDTATLLGQTNTLNYAVRDGISYFKDTVSFSARYRPVNLVALLGTYEFTHLEREDVAQWQVLPGQSNVHRFNVSAQSRNWSSMEVKASYDYTYYDNPSYNSTPDTSSELRLTTNYTPQSGVNLYFEYVLGITERDSLYFLNNSPAVQVKTGGREGRRDQFLASISTELTTKASLTASWFFQRWDVEQDLAYGKWLGIGAGDLPYVDVDVGYTDTSNSFSLSLFYAPAKNTSVLADIIHTTVKGKTGYDDLVGSAPFTLSSFSPLKATETAFSLEITRRVLETWEVGLKAGMMIYNDRATGSLDGNAFSTLFKVKRFF